MARTLIGNIKGPKGDTGSTGPIGPVGPVGPVGPTGEVDKDTPIEFTEAEQRANLVSGDSIKVLFGKAKKFFSDLSSVAFSGSYLDLTDKPAIPSAPADIGAASIRELVGCWKAYRWAEAGWRRVASITESSCQSCVISIKRHYNNSPSECHKVELINTHSSSIFKSVHDKADENNKLLTKIRIVKISNKLYMDVYYDSISENLLTVTISDAVSCTGESWSMISDSIVPEIATDETILAEMDFQANSWIPDKYGPDNKPTPAGIGAVSADELKVRKYVMPQPSANDIFKSFTIFDFLARRTGKVVNLVINLSGTMEAVNDMTLLGTLPKEYWPSDNSVIQNYVSQTGAIMIIQISLSGEVLLYNSATKISGRICGQTVTYVAD